MPKYCPILVENLSLLTLSGLSRLKHSLLNFKKSLLAFPGNPGVAISFYDRDINCPVLFHIFELFWYVVGSENSCRHEIKRDRLPLRLEDVIQKLVN